MKTGFRSWGCTMVVSWLAASMLFVVSAQEPGDKEAAGGEHHASGVPVSSDVALQKLMQGNERFVAGEALHPDQTLDRRAQLTNGQEPFAIVLTCSDSRVPPEIFFDQGLGDIFVIRNAGSVLDDHVIGSMEYAVEHLHVPLIVVVGHEKCGAVSAAVKGDEVSGHLRSVVESLEPAVEQIRKEPGDKVDNAVRANAQRSAEILTHVEPIINAAVRAGKVMVAAARYDLDTGRVEILKQYNQIPEKK